METQRLPKVNRSVRRDLMEIASKLGKNNRLVIVRRMGVGGETFTYKGHRPPRWSGWRCAPVGFHRTHYQGMVSQGFPTLREKEVGGLGLGGKNGGQG